MAQSKKPCSLAQRRVRERSWLLFITEGYICNVQHALTVNNYTLDAETLSLMEEALDRAQTTASELRDALGSGE